MWIGGQNVKQDFSTKTLVLFSDFAASLLSACMKIIFLRVPTLLICKTEAIILFPFLDHFGI